MFPYLEIGLAEDVLDFIDSGFDFAIVEYGRGVVRRVRDYGMQTRTGRTYGKTTAAMPYTRHSFIVRCERGHVPNVREKISCRNRLVFPALSYLF